MIVALVSIWTAALPLAGALAALKNRSIPGWLALALIFPPVVLVLAFLPRRAHPSWLWRRVIGMD